MSPATTGEVRCLFESVERQFDKLRFDIENGKLIPPQLHALFLQPTLSLPSITITPGSSQLLSSGLSQIPTVSAACTHSGSVNNNPLVVNSQTTHQLSPPRSKNKRSAPPFPHATIPNIKPGRDAWREAVKHWEDSRLIPNGRALKDWPVEWYTGGMSRFTGSKYTQRKDIAQEYIRCVCLSSFCKVCA